MIRTLKFLNNLFFKPFHIFWDTISFGISKMEYRASATLGLVLFFVLNSFFDKVFGLNGFEIQIAVGFFCIVFYVVISLFFLITGSKIDYGFICLSDRVYNITLALSYIIFSVSLYLY